MNVRESLRVAVQGVDGQLYEDLFLIDTGADRTVFSAPFARRLNLPANPAPPGYQTRPFNGSLSMPKPQ